MRTPLFRWSLAVYALFVVGLVALADGGGTMRVFSFLRWVPLGDKVGHFVLMGTLALLAVLATGPRGPVFRGVRVPWGALVVAAIVTLEELSQALLVTRSFELADLASDYAGIALFTTVAAHVLGASPTVDGPNAGTLLSQPPPAAAGRSTMPPPF